MARERDSDDHQLRTFAQELADAIDAASGRRVTRLTHDDLANSLGARTGNRPTKAAVGKWIQGKFEPSRTTVFALEEELGLQPGQLSRHLGYLPADAQPAKTLEDVLAADATITQAQRELLLEMYRLNQRQTAERRARRG